jgi:opacity protein-like surface antigen
MMKNLLILMLALVITSVANAAFTLVVDGEEVGDEIDLIVGGLIDIGIYNDTPGDSSNTRQLLAYVIIYDVTGGEWTGLNNVYIPPAVPGSYNHHDPDGMGLDVFLGNFTNPNPYFSGVGVLGDYQYRCLALGHDVMVELMDGTTATILDSLTIHQIPEPMTIALLGLGGLFLLRRRK